MPAENTCSVRPAGSRVGHQMMCLMPSMLQDLSAMEHKQNSCSSRQSVTTTQWAWHQVFRLASSCFSGCRMVFPLILNPQSENVCSALNSLIDQALHYPYSMKVLAEVIQLMLFPFQKIVLRLALTMPRLHVWVMYGPTCSCFPPLLSRHVAKSWKWRDSSLFRGNFCKSLSARKSMSLEELC